MAEAPNLTTSKVRLWDRLLSDYNVDSGDGLVLHPETELAAVVMATDDYIVSSGNSLTLNADSVWSGNISGHVASEYCPLSKVVDGNTQYAEMYVSNGSATVTEVPTSTGYGTLINALSTTTSVGPVSGASSATNDYIPTERAVALALEGKQQVLSGGACITLTPGANYTDISVNVQTDTPLPDLTNATQDKVPTEYVVRHAIDVAGNACSSYAYGLVDALDASIHNAGYAASAWCLNTFLQKGESPEPTPGGDWSYATAESAGVVLPYNGGGLSVSAGGSLGLAIATDSTLGGIVVGTGLTMSNTSKLRLRVASGNAIGGVMVPANSGLTLNSTTGNLVLSKAPVGVSTTTYANAVTSIGTGGIGGVYVMNHIECAAAAAHTSQPVVPTVNAVYSAIDAAKCPHTFTSGLSENSTTYVVTLDSATTSDIGGVVVPTGKGLSINSGSMSLLEAPMVNDYDIAATSSAAGTLGGVLIMSSIMSAGTGQSGCPVVPTVDAVYSAIQAASGGGGKPVSSGGGVTVTDNTTSYTLTLNRAGTTSASYGGVYVPTGSGLVVVTDTTNQGKLYLDSATATKLGGVSVPTGKGLSITSGALAMSRAPVSSVTYTSAYEKLSSGSMGGVFVLRSIQSADTATQKGWAIVPTVDAVYSAIQQGYKGPFAASAVTSTAVSMTVGAAGGYVKWLDGHTWVGDSSPISSGGTLKLLPATSQTTGEYVGSSSYLYLVGSSGAAEVKVTARSSYIRTGGGINWYRYDGSADTDINVDSTIVHGYAWSSGGSSRFTTTYPPESDDIIYYPPIGSSPVTSYSRVSNTVFTISAGGKVYSKATFDSASDIFVWSDTTSGGEVYTEDYWPAINDMAFNYGATSLGYTNNEPDLPPAGKFYTMIAQNQEGTLKQFQYGNVWHEHWGDDYKGQFAISRITIHQGLADSASAGTYPYRYVLGRGGIVYGGPDFKRGGIGLVFDPDNNLMLYPGNLEYPIQSVTNSVGTAIVVSNGLYPAYGTTTNVWLTIVPPDTVGPSGYEGAGTPSAVWRFLVGSKSLETTVSNAYSINLGWITNNGAPQQEHKGAISIRGRWS